jgi:hypothetical protein
VKTIVVRRSFNSGELDPMMDMRADQTRYDSGCLTMENFIPIIYGAAQRSPGTEYIYEPKYQNKRFRLYGFEYSIDDVYVLEFGDKYIRFYRDGGIVLDGLEPYEIETPYSEAHLFNLSFAPSGDVLHIFGGDAGYQERKLERFGHTDWKLSVIGLEGGPFDDENTDETFTITIT